MKLWVLPTLWNYFSKYWDKFAQPAEDLNLTKRMESPIQQIKMLNSNPSTRKKRKLCKYSITDIPDSLDESRESEIKKYKKILKKNSQKQKERHKKSSNGINAFMNDFGEEISEIGAKQSSESGDTVEQILTNMNSKITIPRPYIMNLPQMRKQHMKEKMLANQLFGQTIKNRILGNSQNVSFSMRKFPRNHVPIYEASKPVQAFQLKLNQRI